MSTTQKPTKAVTQTDIKNGTLPNVTPPKNEDTSTPTNGVQVPAKVEKSINMTLQRIRELNHLADKREKLLDTQERLNKFKLSTDKAQDRLVLTDGWGNTFDTNNTTVIADVLAMLKGSLNALIIETEILLTV
jgi:hypothetical protein